MPERVSRFAELLRGTTLGMIPEKIVRKFGHLSLALVHAALAYFHANRAEIDAGLASAARETGALEEQYRRRSIFTLTVPDAPRRGKWPDPVRMEKAQALTATAYRTKPQTGLEGWPG